MRIHNTAFYVNFKSPCHLHLFMISPLELSQLGQQLSTAKLPTAVRQELHNSMEEAKSGGKIIHYVRTFLPANKCTVPQLRIYGIL